MPKTRPPRSMATSAAMLARRRATATRVLRASRYGLAERMSSTGAADGCSVGRTGAFVLTGAVYFGRSVALDELSKRYSEHNRSERGAGFVFARPEREVLFLFGRPPENDPTHLQMFSAADVRALLAEFEEAHVHFVAGRLVPLHPRLFANDIVFAGRKPR